jgi:nicotinamidase-related amidase
MPDVVLIIDMLKGFCEAGNPLYVGESIREIIPRVQTLLQRELDRGSRLIFICDHHQPDDPEFQMFPRHCVAGTPEAEVIPELANYPGEVVYKNRYSGFFGTDLEERLKRAKAERILVCGDCTSICVMFTVADARNRDYPVDVYVDCVADFDAEAHAFALKHMERVLGARLVSLDQP